MEVNGDGEQDERARIDREMIYGQIDGIQGRLNRVSREVELGNELKAQHETIKMVAALGELQRNLEKIMDRGADDAE